MTFISKCDKMFLDILLVLGYVVGVCFLRKEIKMKSIEEMVYKAFRLSGKLNLYCVMCDIKKERIKKEAEQIKELVDEIIKLTII